MPTKEQKQKWLDALRSGKYSQGTGGLHNRNTKCFCCLGVLREVTAFPVHHVDSDGDVWYGIRDENCDHAFIPEEGLDLDKDTQQTLADMNDGGKSFKVIADYIEQHILAED